MKRFALAILLVTAVAATVFAILNRPGAEATPPGATITVNSVQDNNIRDGELTLREAMMLANGDLWFIFLSEEECAQVSTLVWSVTFCAIEAGNPPGADYADTIEFASFGPVALITLGSNLPILWGGDDTIDASSSSTTWVVDGEDNWCFQITSNNNVVKGLEIYSCYAAVHIFDGAQNNTVGGSNPGEGNPGEGNVISGNYFGVGIQGSGTNGNVVKGNYIGTDPSGTVALPNSLNGVDIGDGAQNNTIGGSGPGEGNVISGNGIHGVSISSSGTNGNTVQGNFIGIDASGTVAIPNGSFGVEIIHGPQDNTIGGSNPGEGNVISGNDIGVAIWGSGTDGNVVKGNYIGTDASGTVAVANYTGVNIYDGAQNNTVGGSNSGEGNVISGNDEAGVLISDAGTDGNAVEGNYIGTNATGDGALPNFVGVEIIDGAQNNTVGGSTQAERNVISGNDEEGVLIWGADTDGNAVKGNFIGTDTSGRVAVPNDEGVYISSGAQNNTIGGTGAGEGNLIAFNDGHGVVVSGEDIPTAPPTGNTIRGNSIHSNDGKGIENDSGGNEELEPPTVESVGSVFGTACPNCIVDIYSDEEDEGRVYEGSATADGDGNWSFPDTPEGPNITATATDSDGNTSEFSAPLEPPWPAPSPTPTPSPTPVSDTDGDTVPDDVEDAFGSDPDDPDSTPEALGFDPDTCTDGVDNDGDGMTDAEDEGCAVALTRTLQWSPGWHNATWSGASTPEEAFACAAGNYAAAYRLVAGGWERYFPDRPDLSNMTDLAQYDAFLILVTGDVTCEMPVAGSLGTERTLDWGVGWQNEGWTGADGTTPQDAFACADGSYAAAYRLVGGGWERYFPDRPDLSNMGPLDEYDAFLILVTAPVSCSMTIAP